MEVTMQEYEKVSSINRHIRDQLTAQQEKAFRTEETLKVQYYCVLSNTIVSCLFT
jgi:hypothetical protein